MTKRERCMGWVEDAQGLAVRLMALGHTIVNESCELKTLRHGHEVYAEANELADALQRVEEEMNR